MSTDRHSVLRGAAHVALSWWRRHQGRQINISLATVSPFIATEWSRWPKPYSGILCYSFVFVDWSRVFRSVQSTRSVSVLLRMVNKTLTSDILQCRKFWSVVYMIIIIIISELHLKMTHFATRTFIIVNCKSPLQIWTGYSAIILYRHMLDKFYQSFLMFVCSNINLIFLHGGRTD